MLNCVSNFIVQLGLCARTYIPLIRQNWQIWNGKEDEEREREKMRRVPYFLINFKLNENQASLVPKQLSSNNNNNNGEVKRRREK